jgi:SAM-dependent methyltransferase
MNTEEYANIERLERDHWYYAGKRQMVREWLERVRPPKKSDVLLDCGAGTGFFAQEMERQCRVLVLDTHEESLRRLRQRFGAEQVLTLKDNEVPLPAGSLDYVTALDVLEHVPDDKAVVTGFKRLLKPGGLAIVTVPVGMELWSDWDRVLQHYRRYERRQLCNLFRDDDWEIVHVNHTNVLVYPAVWLVRKWRALREKLGLPPPLKRSEDQVPPPWLNGLLRGLFVGMARWRVPLPFGVSLLLVARRR